MGALPTASDAGAISPPKVTFRIDATDATDVADFTDTTPVVYPDLALSLDRRDVTALDSLLSQVRAPAEATLQLVRTLDAASDATPCVALLSSASTFFTVQHHSFSAPGRSTRLAHGVSNELRGVGGCGVRNPVGEGGAWR